MLSEKIRTNDAKIGVIGLGYVGLPLALLAAEKGYTVLGVDSDSRKVASLTAGHSYISCITDIELQAGLQNNLKIEQDYRALAACDLIVICVPTPLSNENTPDISNLVSAATGIAAILRREQLVIIESTVAPGTTDATVLPLLEAGGLKAGRDFSLAYSPERIDPGNKQFALANTPKLVAGLTPSCRSYAQSFYETLGLAAVPVRTLAVAETAKLLENTYRDINIAFINEMALVCRSSGIDIWEVIDAASTKPFGFQPFYPGPGVGGHCIPVDSVYYAHWARANGRPARLAEHARRVNARMPHYLSQWIDDVLQEQGKTTAGSSVLVLGITYKKDISDTRESPVIELMKHLMQAGANVQFHDPAVQELRIGSAELQCVTLDQETIANQDCVVLAVAHSAYHLSWLQEHSPLILDLVNGLGMFTSAKIRKL